MLNNFQWTRQSSLHILPSFGSMFEAFVKLNNAESISCSANWACSRTWVSKLVQNGDNPNIEDTFVAWYHGIWCNIRIAIHGLSKLGARQRSRDSHEHNQDVKGQRGYHLALAEESLDIINSSLHSIVTVSECSLRIIQLQLAGLY